MRVLVWPADDQGCGNYRLRFPADELARQGCDVTIDTTGPKVLWDREWAGDTAPVDARILGLADTPAADVVVMQRPGRAHWTELIPHLQAAGVRVVVDVDDDFDAIPKGNVAHTHYDPRRSPRHNRDWIRAACDLADLVTVSTSPLAGRYGRHGRVAVLPNMVPDHYLQITATDPLPCAVGWSGSVDTHPDDLQSTGGAVRDVLANQPGWSMHVVGTGRRVAAALRLPDTKVTSTCGWLPFTDYPTALARLTVGIVPLARSRFNQAKSCLKLAEMSALGVPTVAASTPDNQRLHNYGVGVLADSPSQWAERLERLVTDSEWRAEVATRSREAMTAHTYRQWADLWWTAWERALDRKTVAA